MNKEKFKNHIEPDLRKEITKYSTLLAIKEVPLTCHFLFFIDFLFIKSKKSADITYINNIIYIVHFSADALWTFVLCSWLWLYMPNNRLMLYPSSSYLKLAVVQSKKNLFFVHGFLSQLGWFGFRSQVCCGSLTGLVNHPFPGTGQVGHLPLLKMV